MRGLLIILVLCRVVAAGTIEDTIPDARYREYGETFSRYTCRLIGVNTDGEPQVGTCTLLAPHWALTAAHVVEGMATCFVLTDAGPHRIDRVFTPRDYAGRFAEGDIALVHVVRAFPLTTYPPLTDGTERLGSVATAVGYGVTGPLSQGYGRGDNQIRAGTVLLTAQERCVWMCDIRRTGTPLPLCIAPGDSGGGLWSTAADGRTVLVGVNSFTSRRGRGPTRSQVGEESGHTRVAMYREWMHEVAGRFDEPCNLAACR